MSNPRRRKVTMLISGKLLDALAPTLLERKLKLEDVVSLYLRSLANGTKNAALSPADEMPIGKYRGELVGTVIRAEPKYISWILAQENTTLRLNTESLELLEKVLTTDE